MRKSLTCKMNRNWLRRVKGERLSSWEKDSYLGTKRRPWRLERKERRIGWQGADHMEPVVQVRSLGVLGSVFK